MSRVSAIVAAKASREQNGNKNFYASAHQYDDLNLRAVIRAGSVHLDPLSKRSMRVLPERRWRVMKFIDTYVPRMARSPYFRLFMNITILFSCICVGVGVDAEKYDLNWDAPFFIVTENLFLCLFILEYAVTFYTYGFVYAAGKWGLFDLVIVVASVVALWPEELFLF